MSAAKKLPTPAAMVALLPVAKRHQFEAYCSLFSVRTVEQVDGTCLVLLSDVVRVLGLHSSRNAAYLADQANCVRVSYRNDAHRQVQSWATNQEGLARIIRMSQARPRAQAFGAWSVCLWPKTPPPASSGPVAQRGAVAQALAGQGGGSSALFSLIPVSGGSRFSPRVGPDYRIDHEGVFELQPLPKGGWREVHLASKPVVVSCVGRCIETGRCWIEIAWLDNAGRLRSGWFPAGVKLKASRMRGLRTLGVKMLRLARLSAWLDTGPAWLGGVPSAKVTTRLPLTPGAILVGEAAGQLNAQDPSETAKAMMVRLGCAPEGVAL